MKIWKNRIHKRNNNNNTLVKEQFQIKTTLDDFLKL